MDKFHLVQSVRTDDTHLYLTIDGQSYRIRWIDCTPRLQQASPAQRQYIEVSPSGYGLHWPVIDEDLAITPLLRVAEVLETEPPRGADNTGAGTSENR